MLIYINSNSNKTVQKILSFKQCLVRPHPLWSSPHWGLCNAVVWNRKRTSDSSSVRLPTTSLQFDTRSSRWSWRHSSSWNRPNKLWLDGLMILLQNWGVSSQNSVCTCPVSVFSLHHLPRSVMQRFWSSGSNFTSRALWWRILWTSTLQSLVSCTVDGIFYTSLMNMTKYYDKNSSPIIYFDSIHFAKSMDEFKITCFLFYMFVLSYKMTKDSWLFYLFSVCRR